MIGTVTRLHLLGAALLAALACAALAASAPGVADVAAHRHHPASRYPAGATRPAFTAGRAALAAAKKKRKPKTKPKPLLHGDPARGLLAFQAMQSGYYLLGAGLYKGEPFSYLWPFSQGLAATVS